MDHDWLVRLVVLANVFQFESSREVEIKLNRSQLPQPANGILDFNVDLGTVKGRLTFNAFIRKLLLIQSRNKGSLSQFPVFITPDELLVLAFAFNRQLNSEFFKTERLQQVKRKANAVDYLVSDRLGRAEKVRIILSKPSHTHQAVQCARELGAVTRAQFRVTQRQVAI